MDKKGEYIPLNGEATNVAGGLFADAVTASWLKDHGIAGTGDATAGYRPAVPEQLLRCRPDEAAVIGGAAAGAQVQMAPQMAVEIHA